MKLGLSSFAYAWAVGIPNWPAPEAPLRPEDLVKRCAHLGLSRLQLADNCVDRALLSDARRLEELKLLAQTQGVVLELGGRGLHPENLTAHLDACRRLDCRLLRFVIDGPGYEPSLESLRPLLQSVRRQLEKQELSLALENHDRLPARELGAFISSLDHPRIGICLDTANSLGCGEGFETVFEQLAPHTLNFHMKDVRIRRLPHQLGFSVNGCAAGDGIIPLVSSLARLSALGRCQSALLELWPEPRANIAETVTYEHDLVLRSLAFLKNQIPP